eukprot:Rmarinus@m.20856
MASINVAVRVRPLLSDRGREECVHASGNTIRIGVDSAGKTARGSLEETRDFSYHRVYGQKISNTALYQDVGTQMLQKVMDGYTATLFAYGQTGSGKTYTMSGNLESDPGLAPRLCGELFDKVQKQRGAGEAEFNVAVSYYQVYEKTCCDLLKFTGAPLRIVRDTMEDHFMLQNLTHQRVTSLDEAMTLFREGAAHRSTASTKMNMESSRSHAVFSVHLERLDTHTGEKLKGMVNFVDLAGSERVSRTGATGQRLREGASINESLLYLTNVLHDLALGKKSNFRNHPLTMLMKRALCGDSLTWMIANITPALADQKESISTLKLAGKVKAVKTKPIQHVELSKEVEDLRSQILAQEQEIQRLKDNQQSQVQGAVAKELQERLQQAELEKDRLLQEQAVAVQRQRQRFTEVAKLSAEQQLKLIAELHPRAATQVATCAKAQTDLDTSITRLKEFKRMLQVQVSDLYRYSQGVLQSGSSATANMTSAVSERATMEVIRTRLSETSQQFKAFLQQYDRCVACQTAVATQLTSLRSVDTDMVQEVESINVEEMLKAQDFVFLRKLLQVIAKIVDFVYLVAQQQLQRETSPEERQFLEVETSLLREASDCVTVALQQLEVAAMKDSHLSVDLTFLEKMERAVLTGMERMDRRASSEVLRRDHLIATLQRETDELRRQLAAKGEECSQLRASYEELQHTACGILGNTCQGVKELVGLAEDLHLLGVSPSPPAPFGSDLDAATSAGQQRLSELAAFINDGIERITETLVSQHNIARRRSLSAGEGLDVAQVQHAIHEAAQRLRGEVHTLYADPPPSVQTLPVGAVTIEDVYDCFQAIRVELESLDRKRNAEHAEAVKELHAHATTLETLLSEITRGNVDNVDHGLHSVASMGGSSHNTPNHVATSLSAMPIPPNTQPSPSHSSAGGGQSLSGETTQPATPLMNAVSAPWDSQDPEVAAAGQKKTARNLIDLINLLRTDADRLKPWIEDPSSCATAIQMMAMVAEDRGRLLRHVMAATRTMASGVGKVKSLMDSDDYQTMIIISQPDQEMMKEIYSKLVGCFDTSRTTGEQLVGHFTHSERVIQAVLTHVLHEGRDMEQLLAMFERLRATLPGDPSPPPGATSMLPRQDSSTSSLDPYSEEYPAPYGGGGGRGGHGGHDLASHDTPGPHHDPHHNYHNHPHSQHQAYTHSMAGPSGHPSNGHEPHSDAKAHSDLPAEVQAMLLQHPGEVYVLPGRVQAAGPADVTSDERKKKKSVLKSLKGSFKKEKKKH